MDIKNKLGRSALKAYFVKNAVPTESNFADLIDGMLNPEDGIVKPPADALSIQAVGDEKTLQKAINFYKNFTDTDATWTLSLNPRADPHKPDTPRRPGWSIGDAKGTSKLFIDQSNGNVGIGTIDPKETLDVNGRIKSGPLLLGRWPANNDTVYGFFGVSTVDLNQTQAGNYALLQATAEAEGQKPGRTYLNSPETIHFRIKNESQMVLANDGNFGIGTPSPAQRLHVAGNAQIKNVFIGNPGPEVFDWAAFSHADAPLGSGFLYSAKSHDVRINKQGGSGYIGFQVDGVNKLLMDDSGNVGIGTPKPTAKLDVNGNIHGNADVTVDGVLTTYAELRTPYLVLGNKWRLSGVGDAVPGSQPGDGWLRLTNVLSNAYEGGFAAKQLWSENGQVVKSDARQKQDVCPLQNCLDDVLALRAVRFTWRDAARDDPRALGLIAQEVENVFPEVVTTGPDGFKGINYSGLIAPLIEALKEQQARIDELGAEIRLLKAS